MKVLQNSPRKPYVTSIAAAKETSTGTKVATPGGLFKVSKEQTEDLEDIKDAEEAFALLSTVFNESLTK